MNNSITVGDVVRVRKDAPRMYDRGRIVPEETDCKVDSVEDDNAVITHGPLIFPIPTKHLVKVSGEAKNEPKFHKGDKVISKTDGRRVFIVEDYSRITHKYQLLPDVPNPYAVIHRDEWCLEPHISPSEPKKPSEEASFSVFRDVNIANLYNFDWQRYTAQLAHDIAVAYAKQRRNPAEAVKAAKAVVEGLKKK